MTKHARFSAGDTVRTRRAYFDCRFGQLHVRTAFPATGGFDEGVTLFCLHPEASSSRIFDAFLPLIADDRSVYAPDLPGSGESDAGPDASPAEAAAAVADLASDLRLRRIDVLGLRLGAHVALELAASRRELVRRLVLAGLPAGERLPADHERLVLDIGHSPADPFQNAPQRLAQQIAAFLNARP